ncbi:phosphoenolpyruvate--protein phosphotransferase [Liberiplasma polymorphum]|uniref:phosphoenolpyruvate--protein phosphotransferase n=1 Tax=Liberiplasma polymorphum TaxID=3374570 RepID=UPI003770FCE3
MYKGKIASQGLAIAKAYIYIKEPIKTSNDVCEDIDTCIKTFKKALSESTTDIEKVIESSKNSLDAEHVAIFEAHIQMINDVEIIDAVKKLIKEDSINPAKAYEKVTNEFVTIFENMEDAYFKERASDIKDIQYRVLSHLVNSKIADLSLLDQEVIIVAEDLAPSDTASLNLEYVKGFITEQGGYTSHTAIMARALNIPAIVGVDGIVNAIDDDTLLILDALDNHIYVSPNDDQLNKAKKTLKAYNEKQIALKAYKDKKTITLDNHHVGLFANIGSIEDLKSVKANGAEGIGLFRTEFLFMNSEKMPTLDEQVASYKKVFKAINTVIVRTLDIGGDKSLPYLSQEKEDNPFLGHRAIRLCLEETDLFKTQLKALLIASADQKVLRIMIPMIARLDEILKTKVILNEVIEDLEKNNESYQKNTKLGIMIEIPSAALNVKTLAKHIDFISIGSNDLIQYLYAADRMNKKVTYLYEPFDPTLIRLLYQIIKDAKSEGVETGLCGEIGSINEIALLLTAMGIDEISMNASSILEIRALLSKVKLSDLKTLLDDVLKLDQASTVKDTIKQFKEVKL